MKHRRGSMAVIIAAFANDRFRTANARQTLTLDPQLSASWRLSCRSAAVKLIRKHFGRAAAGPETE